MEADLRTPSESDPGELSDSSESSLEAWPVSRRNLESDTESDTESDSDSDPDYVPITDSSHDEDLLASHFLAGLEPTNSITPGQPNFHWHSKENVPRPRDFSPSGNGINPDLQLTADSSPLDFFSVFFSEDLMSEIARFTNQNAASSPLLCAGSHTKGWVDLTVAELHLFFALSILMDICPKPHLKQYWSMDEILSTPLYGRTMSRDRFLMIHRYLYFADPADRSEEDKLWRLRPIIDHLGRAFMQAFTPPKKITVDESLWKFRGQVKVRQYKPTKRARLGLKVYKLAVSEGPCSGYVHMFKVYTGQDRSSVLSPTKAVLDLMEASQLFEKGYELYLDKLYTSPMLFHLLQAKGTNAVGTVRVNRKYLPQDFTKDLPLFGAEHRSTQTGLLCIKWRLKKDKILHLLSTVHTSKMVETGEVTKKGERKFKPQVVIDYDDGMKGVNVSDQQERYYPVSSKSIKWYKKLLYYLIEMGLVNAFLLQIYAGGSYEEQTHYRMELVREMICKFLPQIGDRQKKPAPSQNGPGRLNWSLGHFPKKIETYRRCRKCSKTGRRKMVKVICTICEVPLCVDPCFEDYHTLFDYS